MLDNVFREPKFRLKLFAGRVIPVGVENPKNPNSRSCPPCTHHCNLFPSPFCFHTCQIIDPVQSFLSPGHQEQMWSPLCALSVLHLDWKGSFCGIPLVWELRKGTPSSLCVNSNHIPHAGASFTSVSKSLSFLIASFFSSSLFPRGVVSTACKHLAFGPISAFLFSSPHSALTFAVSFCVFRQQNKWKVGEGLVA